MNEVQRLALLELTHEAGRALGALLDHEKKRHDIVITALRSLTKNARDLCTTLNTPPILKDIPDANLDARITG